MPKVNASFIDPQSIFIYIDWLLTNKTHKDTSIKRKFVCLKSFYRYYLGDAIHFTSVRFKQEKRLPKTLTIQEITKVLKTADAKLSMLESDYLKKICIRDNAIPELLFCTGIRIGELVNILLVDFNIETCTLLIHGKGRKQRNIYVSSPSVMKKLAHWLAVRETMSSKSESMFINKYGKISMISLSFLLYRQSMFSNSFWLAIPIYNYFKLNCSTSIEAKH